MQATQHAACGTRLVVLDKRLAAAGRRTETGLIEGFKKITAIIAEYLRFDDDNIRYGRIVAVHDSTYIRSVGQRS